jgi:hypothetical protein
MSSIGLFLAMVVAVAAGPPARAAIEAEFAAQYAELQAQPSGGSWSEERSSHVFKVNADGSSLEQFTDGPWNNVDPCWLPDEDFRRISLWLDGNCDFYGSYEQVEAQDRGEVVRPTIE